MDIPASLLDIEREFGFAYPRSFRAALAALLALSKSEDFATAFPDTRLLLSATEVRAARDAAQCDLLPFMWSDAVPDIYAFDPSSDEAEQAVVVWAVHAVVHEWSGFPEFFAWLQACCAQKEARRA